MSAAQSKSDPDRFRKAAEGRKAPAEEVSAPRPERGHTAVRSKPMRTTVDLSPSDHRRLRRIADRLADDLDMGEVPRRSVWLALLAELSEDEALYERVLERVREGRDDVPTA